MGGHFLTDRSIARPPHRSKYLPFVPTNLATWFELATVQLRLPEGTAGHPHRMPAGGRRPTFSGKRGNAMTNQQTQNSDKANRNQTIALLLPRVLIGHFLWNVLTPAHEFPMRSVQVMTMTFDFLMLVGCSG